MNRANEALARWAIEWQPIVPAMPTDHAAIARFASGADDGPRIYAAVDDFASGQAVARHPEHGRLVAQAAAADRGVLAALGDLLDTRDRHERELGHYGRLGDTQDPRQQLAQIEQQIATTEQRLGETRTRITHLEQSLAASAPSGPQPDPGVDTVGRRLPPDPVAAARSHWLARRDAEQHERTHRAAPADSTRSRENAETWREHQHSLNPARLDHGIDR